MTTLNVRLVEAVVLVETVVLDFVVEAVTEELVVVDITSVEDVPEDGTEELRVVDAVVVEALSVVVAVLVVSADSVVDIVVLAVLSVVVDFSVVVADEVVVVPPLSVVQPANSRQKTINKAVMRNRCFFIKILAFQFLRITQFIYNISFLKLQ